MNRIKATLAGIGCGLAATAAVAVALGGQTMENRALTAAHPTPTATTTVKLPGATITKTLPQATKTITVKTPPKVVTVTKTRTVKATYLQCPGHSEDSCWADYIGDGRWVLRVGERPMPKATTRVSKKTPIKTGVSVPGVCRHPSIITRGQLQDCIKLAQRPKVVTASYEIPNGRVLVKECTDQYKGSELSACLKQ